MKFTVVFIAALSISATCAIKVQKDDPKDKREAAIGYPSHSPHSYQPQSLGHGDASAISIGAGYSVGGVKPSFNLEGHGAGGGYQLSAEGLPASGHGTIQLAPITLQPSQSFAAADLSQLMSQLSHGLNSGALSLQSGESYQGAAHGGGEEISLPQYSYGAPKLQQYAVSEQPSVPSYAAGTKGLGSYSTGPVLFSPSDSHGNAQSLTYGAPNSGYSFAGSSGSGHSLGGLSGSGHSLGALSGSGHSFGGLSGAGHSLGGSSGSGHSFISIPSHSGHSFGGLSSGGHSLGDGALTLGSSGHSLHGLTLGNIGHSFGGSIKSLGSSYGAPSKTSFKPSAFLGASVQGDGGHGGHGLSSLSSSYGAPSFGGFSGGASHGLSLGSGEHGGSFGGSLGGFGGGSSKFVAPFYLPSKSEGFGSSLESSASFSSGGHAASPPGTTYGVPTSSYGVPSSAAHAASSTSPQYYVQSKNSFPSFGGSSSSYRAPSSGSHSSLSSYSSGPKHGFSSHSSPSSRYGSPRDVQGAHSETSYNTIKYSEELKPRAH